MAPDKAAADADFVRGAPAMLEAAGTDAVDPDLFFKTPNSALPR